ncbi:MAG: hypothetical protein ACXVCP_04875 [Bdellovibrio sp.]
MKLLIAVIFIGLIYNTKSHAGGSEVTNPWPWGSSTSLRLDGPAAKDFIESLKEADEQFAQSLSASSSECVVDGFGGRVPHYSGKIGGHALTESQAEKLCYALHLTDILKYQPPYPCGLYTLFTDQIVCAESSGPKCIITIFTNQLPAVEE